MRRFSILSTTSIAALSAWTFVAFATPEGASTRNGSIDLHRSSLWETICFYRFYFRATDLNRAV